MSLLVKIERDICIRDGDEIIRCISLQEDLNVRRHRVNFATG